MITQQYMNTVVPTMYSCLFSTNLSHITLRCIL